MLNIIQDQVMELHAPCASGKTMHLRRCGAIPDLFCDENGRIFRLQEPARQSVNGYPAIRYEGCNIMLRHLVADAFMPGWDEDRNAQVRVKDANPDNCEVSNPEIVSERGRGRPRDNAIIRQLRCCQLVVYTHNIDLVMEELKMTRDQCIEACAKWAPYLLMASYPQKIEGLPRHYEKIGASRRLKQMARKGILRAEDAPVDPTDPDS